MNASKPGVDGHGIQNIERLKATPINSELLKIAWERQKVYSRNASASQTRFYTLRRLISVLNVATIFLSIIHTEVSDFEQTTGDLLILLPILISGLLAFAVKYDRGNNWLLLRGNAEALKTEIYYYLTGVGEYSKRRDEVLAHKIKLISERLKGSTVHQGSLRPFEEEVWERGLLSRLNRAICGTVGDRYGALRRALLGGSATSGSYKPVENLLPAAYIPHRLEAQFNWYRQKSRQFDRELQVFQAFIYTFGGLGTLLAALGEQAWVATTTAMAGALINYLEFKRVESTLVGYNQTADALYDIRTWWKSLTAKQQGNWKNFELLVQGTEETIRSEHTSWLHDMQDKLAQIYGQTDLDDGPLDENGEDNKAEGQDEAGGDRSASQPLTPSP